MVPTESERNPLNRIATICPSAHVWEAMARRVFIPPEPSPTKRARGLAAWNPHATTRALLAKVQLVLEEYAEYLPLTIRQIFYRLVGAHGYAKTEKAYSNLKEMLTRARRGGFIAFEDIRDDGTTFDEPLSWTDANELIDTFFHHAENFRLDRQRGQPVRLYIGVEAQGMVPQVRSVCFPYGVPVFSSGGFDSVTAKYDLAKRLGQFPRTEVLHIGDLDPSGVHLFSSLADDVRTIAFDLRLPGAIDFTRLGSEMRLPIGWTTTPMKTCCVRNRSPATYSPCGCGRCADDYENDDDDG